MRGFFKAVKWMIDPETLIKLSLEGEQAPADLVALFHPSQLEKKYGGVADTPTNYWPPLTGPDYLIDGDESHLEQIKRDEYESILNDNPGLLRHPALIKETCHNTRDFVSVKANAEEEKEGEELLSPCVIEEAANGEEIEAAPVETGKPTGIGPAIKDTPNF